MLTKARKLSNEHHIKKLLYHPISDDSTFSYFKADCKPSMRECAYKVTVCISSFGIVETGYCTCKAGPSAVCCHVGALLLYLLMMKDACTNIGWSWTKPQVSGASSPKRFVDVPIVNTANTTELPPVKPYPGVYKAGPCQDPDQFLQDCLGGLGAVNSTCVLYKVLCDTVSGISSFTSVFEPAYMYPNSVDLLDKSEVFSQFVDGLSLSSDVCCMLEKATRGQHCNKFWKEARSYIITSSNFGSVVKRKPDTAPDILVKKLRQYNTQVDTKPMMYGRTFEKKAVKAYRYVQNHIKICEKLVEVETKGIQVNPKYPYLGASVDGVVSCPQCGVGIVKVKCPLKWRHDSPMDCCKDSSFYCEIVSGKMSLKTNHNYYYQVMG